MQDTEVEKLFSIIKREFALLSEQLEFYRQLFLVEQDCRGKLVGDVAPGFFAMFQMCLTESILMRVSRLMDPEKTTSKANASISRLSSVCPSLQALEETWPKIENFWRCGKFRPVKDLRNKYLAHNDQEMWVDREAGDAWMPITLEDFELMRSLFDELWGLFRCAHKNCFNRDVILGTNDFDPPTVILRHLAGAKFLDELLERPGAPDDEGARLHAHIAKLVGDEAA